MIISFRVLLLFAQDMREWIQTPPPPKKDKDLKKKGTFTYSHIQVSL